MVALFFEKHTHVWGDLSEELEFAIYTFTDDEGRFTLPATHIFSSSGKQVYGTWEKAPPSIRFVHENHRTKTLGVSAEHMEVVLEEGRRYHNEGLNIIRSLENIMANPVSEGDSKSLSNLKDALK